MDLDHLLLNIKTRRKDISVDDPIVSYIIILHFANTTSRWHTEKKSGEKIYLETEF